MTNLTNLALVALLSAFVAVSNSTSAPTPESVLIVGGLGQGHGAITTGHAAGRRLLQQQMTGEPEPIMRWLVDKHNELRARHGAQPMLWDWGLAWNAYNYVLNCPNGHSGAPGIGENLAWGHQDFNHAMRDWYDEIQFYTFERPSFAENTGHLTAMLWGDSNRIGCAANLRCRFKTWICQFTPGGNFVNYGGSVDYALWTAQVRAPGRQWWTGSRPDGTPSYASYDPAGETTRGLPAPMYGELKNFGYVPKPGQVVVLHDWQKYIPTSILQQHIPANVLAQFLDADTLAMITPDKDGKPTERTVVGWQSAIPAKIIKQYVPAPILQKYLPDGSVAASEAEPTGTPTAKDAEHTDLQQSADATPAGSSSQANLNVITSAPTAGSAQPGVNPVTAAPAAGSTQPVANTITAAPTSGSVLAALAGDAGSGPSADAAPQPDPPSMVTAAVLKPRTGLAGLLDDIAGRKQGPDAPATYVPVQQPPAGSTTYLPVQQANGGTAYIPVQAVPMPSTSTYVPAQQVQLMQQEAPAGSYMQMAPPQQPPQHMPAQAVYVDLSITRAAHTAPATGTGNYYMPNGQLQVVGAVPRPEQPAEAAQPTLSSFAQEALNRHNVYRSKHGVPPVAYDPQMAAKAAEFVASCPMGRSGTAGVNVGENLAWGFSDAVSAIDSWYGQVSQYNFASPGYSPASGMFSQLVWADTQRIGCAIAPGCAMPTIVCHYFPAGNVMGIGWGSKVLPAAAANHNAVPGVAAVEKPTQHLDTPPAVYWKMGEPLPNDGAPISLGSPLQRAGQGPAPAAAAVLSPEIQAAVDRHNQYRSKHGVPALIYDDAIAATAQAWAGRCPSGHSGTEGVGENMAWGYANLAAAVEAWYNEIQAYNFNRPGWSSATGHFTQVVWASTTRLGCAVNTACSWPTYVCQYGPPGNVLGTDWSKQVPPLAATPPTHKPSPSPAPRQPVTHAPAPSVATPTAEQSAALAQTNLYRKRHQAAPLIWDAALAASAANWAAGCPQGHSGYAGVGENMAWGYSSLTAAIDAWYNEVKAYNFAKPGFSSATGHFTALVWTDTTKVGCASNSACSRPTHICQYQRPGNSLSADWSTKVKPAATAASPTGPRPSPKPSPKPPAVPLTPAAPLQPVARSGQVPSDWAAALSLHNELRRIHEAPALVWSEKLAASAKSWADGCQFAVSGTAGVGEAVGFGYVSPADAIRAWYKQVTSYDFANPGWNKKAGLFTQMVWSDTKEIGCAVNRRCAWAMYVCQYSPSGNFVGPSIDWSQKVLPASAKLTGQQEPAAAAVLKPLDWIRQPPSNGDFLGGHGSGFDHPADGNSDGRPTQPCSSSQRADTAPPPSQPYSTWTPMQPPAAAQTHNTATSSAENPSGDALPMQQPALYTPFQASDAAPGSGLIVPAHWLPQQQQQQQQPEAPPPEQPVGPGNLQLPAWYAPQPPLTQQPEPAAPSGQPAADVISWVPLKRAPGYTHPANNNPEPQVTATPATPQVPNTQFTPQPPATSQVPTTLVTPAAPGSDKPDTAAHKAPVITAAPMHQPRNPAAPTPAPATPAVTPLPPPSASSAVPPAPAIPPAQQPTGGGSSANPSLPADLSAVLQAHNTYRARHRVPALQWSAALATRAQQYADGCPMGHSGDRGVGENLAWGYPTWQSAVAAWYDEVQQYNFASPGYSGATGHFTALVWRDTTHVGCGMNVRCSMATYACQYSPAGNVIGVDWSQQVLPAK